MFCSKRQKMMHSMAPVKHRCAISVDVDSMWVLSRFHGLDDRCLNGQDTIYQKAIPRFLELFDKYNLKATFFIVGKDCVNSSNEAIFKKIVSMGHEIANHSMNHIFGFSMLSREEKEKEIRESGRIIEETCGYRPVGFRVPGYNIDEITMDILDKEGYLYDSSVYSFFPYSIMRRISYLKSGYILKKRMLSGFTPEFMQSFSPKRVYRPSRGKLWRSGKDRDIFEAPLSVAPLLNIPFNSTFLFLASPKLFDFGFSLTLAKGMYLNYNFHASDMLCKDLDNVPFEHPGLSVPLQEKNILFKNILTKIGLYYDFVTLRKFIYAANERTQQ